MRCTLPHSHSYVCVTEGMFMNVRMYFAIDAASNTFCCFSLVCTVVSCTDPGKVEHSRRVLSGPHLTTGSTIQYVCDKGFVLSGNSLLTCFSRGSSGPKWNQKLPRCLRTYSSEPRFTPTHCFRETHLQIPGEGCMCEHKHHRCLPTPLVSRLGCWKPVGGAT